MPGLGSFNIQPMPTRHSSPRTVCEQVVQRSQSRLLDHPDIPQQQALAWLQSRGFTREMIAHYHIGLERWT